MSQRSTRMRGETTSSQAARPRSPSPSGREWGVLAGVAVVTLALGLAAFALRPSGFSADDIRRSALRATPDGVAGLYRAIARLGTPTAVRATPLVDADPLRGTLVMLQPRRRPSPREVRELLDWVRAGGTLIHAPRANSPILDSLGLVRRTLAGDEDGADAAFARADAEEGGENQGANVASSGASNAGPPPAGDEARDDGDEARDDGDEARDDGDGSQGAAAVPELGDSPLWSRDHPLTQGLAMARPARYAIAPDTASGDDEDDGEAAAEEAREGDGPGPLPAPHHPLLLSAPDSAGHRWTAAAAIPLGDGRIIAFADARPLSNRLAGEAPLAVVAVRAAIAWTNPGDTVFFDEFSQGLGASRSPPRATADFLIGTSAGRASLHLGVVVLLALLCAGLRFGTPLAPARDARRSALEHVTALAAVYESAQARETAAVLMLGRLARASRLPPPRDRADAERLLARLMDRGARSAPPRRILRGLETTPVDLISVAEGIDDHIQRRSSA